MASIFVFVAAALATSVTFFSQLHGALIWTGAAIPLIGVVLGVLQNMQARTRSDAATFGIILNACLCVSVVLTHLLMIWIPRLLLAAECSGLAQCG